MTYTKQVWSDTPSTATPLSGERLNYMEQGIADGDVTNPASPASAEIQKKYGHYVNVKSFGTVGDGIADDTAAIQTAISATPSGGYLVFAPGETYRLTAALTNGGKSVNVMAHGATIVQHGNARAISFSGAWDSSVTILALTPATIVEADSNVMDVVNMTTSGTVTWKRGDVVKVFSSDVIPGVRTDNGVVETQESRTGQFFTVRSVAAGSVELLGTLRDPMTANIKAARLTNTTCSVRGGTFDVSDSFISGGFESDLINLSAMHGPVVENVTVRRAGGSAVVMYSNFGYSVKNTKILWAWNDGSVHFGYGVNDNASTNGTVDGCFFGQVRHGFTDTNSTAAVGEDVPSKYGRSSNWKVSNCVADSTTSSGFDSHQGGEGGTFENCLAINAQNGFAIRGRGHSVLNCRTQSCVTAVRILTENEGGDTWGTVVDGLKAEGTKTLVIAIDIRWNALHNLFDVRDTRPMFISNVKATDTAGNFVRAVNATAHFENMFCEFKTVSGDAITVDNSRATFANVVLDYYRSSGSGHQAFSMHPSTASYLEVNGLRVRGFTILSTRLAKAFSCNSIQVLRVTDAIIDHAPSGAVADVPEIGSWIDYIIAATPGASSSYVALNDAGAVSLTAVAAVALTHSPYVAANVTLTGANQTLAYLPAAQNAGQLLAVVNTSATYSLTVANGAAPKTSLDGGTNKTLTPGQSLLLVALPSGMWQQVKTI